MMTDYSQTVLEEEQALLVRENVKLIWVTPNAEKLIAYMARVSNPKNQDNDNITGLLSYCIKNQHWSIFEMVNACFEINTTRDIGRQILRHKSFAFQEFCVAGDTLITTLTNKGNSKKVSIENLYKRFNSQYWNTSDQLVRVYDSDTKQLIPAKIKEVFKTGTKEVYELLLDNGKSIKSTKDHKFLTKEGFLKLEDISLDSFVACNGILVYQDYAWLKETKQESINNGLGLQYIADKAGVSYHTIRKWLKKLNLSFTKKEVALYTEIWNKGLPADKQPMFNKFHTEKTRNKMRESSIKGENSNLFLSGNTSWRAKVAATCKGYLTELLHKQNFKCAITGETINKDNAEVDHILPVYKHPELAFEPSNLQVLSKKAHFLKSQEESKQAKTTIKWSKVISIKYLGDMETYDMEIDHTDHNYVANGIITHNSQRYADVSALPIASLRECRLQDTKNRQNSTSTDDAALESWWQHAQIEVDSLAKDYYQKALAKGIAKEQARALLPEGITTSRMYMQGTLRSWIHYVQLRSANGTQKEHQDIAKQIGSICEILFPTVWKAL